MYAARPSLITHALCISQTTILAPQDGYVAKVNALTVGRVGVSLGAGRTVADEPVDATAGILFHKKVGNAVVKDHAVATLYCNRNEETLDQARQKIQEAIEYSSTPVAVPAIISHQVTSSGAKEFSMPAALGK